jgi:large subunit ribosomal protein L27
MAVAQGGSSSRKGKDARPKYLGVKIHAGETAKAGNIIVRQRGARFTAGKGAKKGNDDTIYASKEGKVSFRSKKKIGYNGNKKLVKIVTVS